MRRLAIFWLVCAVAGFTIAAGVAVLLSMAIDNRLVWSRPAPVPIGRALDHLQTHPHETLGAQIPAGR